jgi:hypothetical protein
LKAEVGLYLIDRHLYIYIYTVQLLSIIVKLKSFLC